MAHPLTRQSRKVLALATEAARSMGHTYVGTEHILLGLFEEGSAGVAEILEAFQIDAASIRAEIENLVQRGDAPVTVRTLPLTPRVKRAIEVAHNESRLMDQACIHPEQLFLGLVDDPSGVACEVLVKLGVTLDDLRREVFKTRIAQMRIVERAIRPLRASITRKRRMREELLTHLSTIYDEELARLHKPGAALAAAAERFGNPSELAEELQATLPFYERADYFVERWFAWQPPESVVHYALRQSLITFGILATVLPLVFLGIALRYGRFDGVWTLIRVLTSLAVITPPVQFVFTYSWIKMRDSLWGVFGSRKSLPHAVAYGAAIAFIIMASFAGFTAMSSWNVRVAIETLPLAAIAGLVAAAATFIAVRISGPTTIRDTVWAMLDTETA